MRFLECIKQFRADWDGLTERLLAEEIEFTVGVVVAHFFFESGDAEERGAGGIVSNGLVRCVEGDREERAHLAAFEAKALEIFLSRDALTT